MDWKNNGVKIVHAEEMDTNTPQTDGMTRSAAITHARTAPASCGPEPCWCSPTPRPDRIIMENWRPCSSWSKAACGCAGETAWN
jgi:hypothetical protein